MKKIKASSIKPGMVIQRTRKVLDGSKWTDTYLIISKTGFVEPEICFIDYQDPYWGRCHTTLKGKKKVKVITGEARKHVIEVIKKDVFKRFHDVETEIDFIRLIEEMSE